jgi:hypothetical protein
MGKDALREQLKEATNDDRLLALSPLSCSFKTESIFNTFLS